MVPQGGTACDKSQQKNWKPTILFVLCSPEQQNKRTVFKLEMEKTEVQDRSKLLMREARKMYGGVTVYTD